MTICGIACTPDRAIAWADSSVSLGDVIIGHTCKLALNVLAGVIATGTGPTSLIRDADGLVRGAASLSEVVKDLPAWLRSCVQQKTVTTAYAIAGYDHALGRMIVHVFRSPFFAPELTTFFMAPPLEVPRPATTLEALDVAVAQHQAAAGYAGGILSVAELTATGVTARALFDLDTTEFIDGVHARPLGTRGASAECAGAGG